MSLTYTSLNSSDCARPRLSRAAVRSAGVDTAPVRAGALARCRLHADPAAITITPARYHLRGDDDSVRDAAMLSAERSAAGAHTAA